MLRFGRFLDVINGYSREEDTGLAVFWLKILGTTEKDDEVWLVFKCEEWVLQRKRFG